MAACAFCFECLISGCVHVHNVHRYFLKEISSDGDLSTVDVIYPAAPILLALRPELLVRLCIPLLAYVLLILYL